MPRDTIGRLVAVSLLTALMLSTAAFAALPSFGTPPRLKTMHRVIIGYTGDPSAAKRAALEAGLSVRMELPFIHAIVVEAPGLSADAAAGNARTAFMLHGAKYGLRVRYSEPDRPVHAFALSDSPDIQWDVFMVRAPAVWDAAYPYIGDAALGAGVQVAVLDTGIDYTHPDLQGKVAWCANAVDYYGVVTGSPYYCSDGNGHGTHVAGTIAALLDGKGVAGVAPGVTLYAIKVLSDSGSGTISSIAAGIYYAVAGPDLTVGTSDDAEVLSMSLGGPVDDPALRDATYWAYSHGAIIVAAAGNEGDGNPATDEVAYPARYPWVIAVAAVDRNGSSPYWSSEGPEVDVAAPGVDILSTWPGGQYAVLSGTSMATPHVSGVVALIQAIRMAAGLQKLSFEQVYDALTKTAIDLGPPGFDNFTGYGLVDAYNAVAYALQQP